MKILFAIPHYYHYEPGGRYCSLAQEPQVRKQAVLRDALGRYDYYAYLEDDLILLDPWFFHKLAWFDRLAGARCLLQPNRYEVAGYVVARKVYVDGDQRPSLTARVRDVQASPEITAEAFGAPLRFRPALNPHAGCYFLTAEQMTYWAGQPYFLDRDLGFIGPLESAATLGNLRAFSIFKPAREQASFLEIQHVGTQFLSQVGTYLSIVDDAPQ